MIDSDNDRKDVEHTHLEPQHVTGVSPRPSPRSHPQAATRPLLPSIDTEAASRPMLIKALVLSQSVSFSFLSERGTLVSCLSGF